MQVHKQIKEVPITLKILPDLAFEPFRLFSQTTTTVYSHNIYIAFSSFVLTRCYLLFELETVVCYKRSQIIAHHRCKQTVFLPSSLHSFSFIYVVERKDGRSVCCLTLIVC